MPRENKKRGRRAEATEKKRKADDEPVDVDGEDLTKRARLTTAGDGEQGERNAASGLSGLYDQADADQGAGELLDENPFGILTTEEEGFFVQAEQDVFYSDLDDRADSVVNTFFHATGVELKAATHPTVSKFFGRLVMVANTEQICQLFTTLQGNLNELSQHRFGSHVCENLCLRAGQLISTQPTEMDDITTAVEVEPHVLAIATELQPNLADYLTHPFASHVVRVLVAVLSGLALPGPFLRRVLPSRKKDKSDRSPTGPMGVLEKTRYVPAKFSEKLAEMVFGLVSSLDRSGLRETALDPAGSATLQLLLKIEVSRATGKMAAAKLDDSLVVALFPPEQMAEATTVDWMSDLAISPAGAHFLETVVDLLPGKMFKTVYRSFLETRIELLSTGEATSYVLAACLNRLGKDDLAKAITEIGRVLARVVDRQIFDLIRAVVVRAEARGVDLSTFRDQFAAAVASTGTSSSPSDSTAAPAPLNVLRLLKPKRRFVHLAGLGNRTHSPAGKVHASILCQTMLASTGPMHDFVSSGIADVTVEGLMDLAHDSVCVYTLIAFFNRANRVTTSNRRKLVGKLFQPVMAAPNDKDGDGAEGQADKSGSEAGPQASAVVILATDPIGSRLVDALWSGTIDLPHLHCRIGGELMAEAGVHGRVRSDVFGRKVWSNWKLNVLETEPSRWTDTAKEERRQVKETELEKANAVAEAVKTETKPGRAGPKVQRPASTPTATASHGPTSSSSRDDRSGHLGRESGQKGRESGQKGRESGQQGREERFTIPREEYLKLTPLQRASARAAEAGRARAKARELDLARKAAAATAGRPNGPVSERA